MAVLPILVAAGCSDTASSDIQTDAGEQDAGEQDASQCSVFVTPTSGTISTRFEITYELEGSSCSWGLDGLFQGATDCSTVSQTTFPLGTHTVTLSGSGNEGALDCISNIVSVTMEEPPSCSIALSPSGTSDSEFNVEYASDATSCSWSLDGVAQGAVDCSSTNTLSLPPGDHSATLEATSPSGVSSCMSNVVSVEGEGAPTCSVAIGPDNGTVTTSFQVDYASDATTCSWALDGVGQGTAPCNGSDSMMLPPGDHLIALTAVGTGGTSICSSNSVTVAPDESTPDELPTCSASIGPDAGSNTTLFGLNYSSNGTSCSLMVDGVSQGTVPCIGENMRNFLAGDHWIRLIATGPGGTTSCASNTVTVQGESAPTCSVSIGPSNGNTDTMFTTNWSSDASSCTWAIDGINQGSINCQDSDSRTFTPGEHTVTITATGAGGTSICTSNAVNVEGQGAPSCMIQVSPSDGDTNTAFTIETTSDATTCSWRLGFVNKGSIDCSGSLNSTLTAGNQSVSLVATGPGGTSVCNANAVNVVEAEVEAPVPTCSASIGPMNTGDTETDFMITWSSSDATSCSWSLDGINQGVIPCVGETSRRFSTGNHAASVTATGPGGVANCTSNTVSVTDAAQLPVCTMFVNSDMGNTNFDFDVRWTSSDATSCVWLLDGAEQGSANCTGMLSQRLPVGPHTFGLRMQGPGGTSECTSNLIQVSDAPPTCEASIEPAEGGDTTTEFTVSWASNATSCTWQLNNVSQGAIGCSGEAIGPLPPGNNSVNLVATGPGGTVICPSNVVVVSALPTCQIDVNQPTGDTTDQFTVDWSSNATSCTWEFDNINQGPIACSGSSTGPLAVGTHPIKLIATGPGGTVDCSTSVTVSSAPPSCSITSNRTTGTTVTDFNVQWSSDASSCTWELDGVSQGAIGCIGSNNGPLPLGNYEVTLVVTGPGGTADCSINVSVSEPPPECTLELSESNGVVTANWNSSYASTCTWSLDNVNQGDIACSGTASAPLPAGNHSLRINMSGPGGNDSCVDTVNVN